MRLNITGDTVKNKKIEKEMGGENNRRNEESKIRVTSLFGGNGKRV